MTFDYDVYYRQNCILPTVFVFTTAFAAVSLISYWVKNKRADANAQNWACVLALCIILFLLIVNLIPLARGGAYLLFEGEEDRVQICGTIEDTFEMGSIGGAKYPVEHNHGYGEAITVAGNKYYLTTYGNFRVGDYVELEVLPQSCFVLRIEYAN